MTYRRRKQGCCDRSLSEIAPRIQRPPSGGLFAWRPPRYRDAIPEGGVCVALDAEKLTEDEAISLITIGVDFGIIQVVRRKARIPASAMQLQPNMT